MDTLHTKKCIACEGGMPPLTAGQIEPLKQQLDSSWSISNDHARLRREFIFKNFNQSLARANRIAKIADRENHHPDLTISWGKLAVELTTHAIDGLSENDFILAAKIDRLETESPPDTISIDDFGHIKLRVGTVIAAEPVPDSEKLLKLIVDLGIEKRQIVAGIAAAYQPDKLVGRQIVVVANLEPKMLRGVESHGMLLAAGADTPVVLTPDAPVPPGSVVR